MRSKMPFRVGRLIPLARTMGWPSILAPCQSYPDTCSPSMVAPSRGRAGC